ncbi:G8 domain-containing protein [Polaribacter septentrionalilitoris]|uniref:G8 domain-containing protein n=1 Tax=Polaribacter septentrionalilitoris TaxID=2494657 RepID=UPI00135ABD53|nr:G8 domain-containing protein [Polaribacter septentrionalilitoris]
MKKSILYTFVLFTVIFELSANKSPVLSVVNSDNYNEESTLFTSHQTTVKPLDALLAPIQAIKNGSWQDTAIWSTGSVPTANDEVLIPKGIKVDLVGVIKAKAITIQGVLQAIKGQTNNAAIELETEKILVMGASALFEIGTENQPYIANGKCKITLIGEDKKSSGRMGDNFIGAMGGGTIELHGKEKISWTHLGANASIGSKEITMTKPIDWEVGDEIVIVSSRTNWQEAEKRTISAISADKLKITFLEALKYPHFSAVKTYTRAKDSKTWTADLRAEVGLLTHNIKIQGHPNSEQTGFGGHIMAMANSTLNASNIELYRMGQKAKLGKYPWHWHLLHEFGSGQYIKNSSIHKSFNRAITIHGTSYTRVDNNFIYDHIGHGVFLEDGSERFNVIKNNVALLTIKPLKGEEVTPSDNQLNEVQNRTPATYWITNPNNIFENNVAAGTEGTGYWFAFPKKPMGDSAKDPRFNGIEPYKEPLGLFKGNKAHSCTSGVDVFDQLTENHKILSNRGWLNKDEHLFEDCTWYANKLGVYSGLGNSVGNRFDYTNNLVFYNNILVDNATAIQFASFSQIKKSVIVADSGTGILQGNARLYRMYDGPGQIRDSHFVGWNTGKRTFISSGGAATKHTNHHLSGITTENNKIPHIILPNFDIPIKNDDTRPQNPSHPRNWITVLLDEDGSLTGKANSSIVSNHPFMLVGDETKPSHWVRAYVSEHNFASSVLRFPGLATAQIPNVSCRRIKNNTPIASAYHIYGFKTFIQFPFIVNEGFQYNYTFEALPTNKSINIAMENAKVGDNYIVKFSDFGRLGGLNVSLAGKSLTESNSLATLTSSNNSSFYKERNGDLFLKFVATQLNQTIKINWSSNFTVPMLDTDRDLVSDRQEIINGTNPFTDDGTLNIVDFIVDNEANLFPNPVINTLNFSGKYFDLDTNIQIFNSTGKIVLTKNLRSNSSKKSKSIHISELPSGLYIVVMNNKSKTLSKKIVIQ